MRRTKRRRGLICGLAIATAACGGGRDPGGAGDPSAELYAMDRVPRFDLTIPPDSVAALEADPGEYARATFRYGDEVVDTVGVRLKGEETFRPLDRKASFKIKFDEFVAGQTFRGLERLILNNALQDPSFAAEQLSYLVFRNANLPAPRANSAEVHVNGELYGVFANVEAEDKVFLGRWFESSDGNLYEEQGSDWLPGNQDAFELETSARLDERADLIALFSAVDRASSEDLLADVAHVLDTDRFLRYCALEGLVNQWDGHAFPRNGPNNHRLYHDPSTGTFSILPWGMDRSMKPTPEGSRFVNLHDPTGHFLGRCMDSPGCRASYDRILAEEIDRFESLDLPRRAAVAGAQIRDRVRADPRKEHSDAEFDAALGELVEFVTDRPASARAELELAY